MSNLVEFPGLGIEINVPRVAFTIFGLDVYWYGIIIVLGLVLAVMFAYTQCPRFGVDRDRMIDVVMVGLVCALIGGRLYYIIPSDYMTLADFFNFRGGGIGIYGAIIGAFVGAAVMCHIRKVATGPLFDLGGMGFLIGQGIGRWANFFNQEAFGTNTDLPWRMFSPQTEYYLQQHQASLAEAGVIVDPSLPVHPTFLYESLWCAVGFLLLFLYRKHRKFNGELFLFYVMWYGLGRFFIEGLRTDSLTTNSSGLRVSQVVAVVSVLTALIVWIAFRVRLAGRPLKVPVLPDHTAKVTVQTDDGPETVTISWPANTKEPTRDQREDMARLVAGADKKKAEKEEETEECSVEAGVESEEQTAGNEPETADEDAENTLKEAVEVVTVVEEEDDAPGDIGEASSEPSGSGK